MLTNAMQVDNNLSMAGKIRTKEKCPKCKGKFQGEPLQCPACLICPRKYYIDLHYKGHGRLRIFCDRKGNPLDSWRVAIRVIESIRYEIDLHTFDPSIFVAKDLKEFLFETRLEAYNQSRGAEAEKGNISEHYVKHLKSIGKNYYLPYFKGMDIRDIRTYHIQGFYTGLPSSLQLKTIKKIMVILRTFFHSICRDDYIGSMPKFPKIKLHKRIPKWLDEEAQIEIMKRISERDRPIFIFLGFQGVRPGEARGLKVKDINFEAKYLTISRTHSNGRLSERVKGKVEKRRFINPELMELLREQCRDKVPEAFVFINRLGRNYSEMAMSRIWRKARGETKISLYEATRHSWASNAVQRGVPLTAIRDVLGHADIQTTMIYAHSDFCSQKVAFKPSMEKKVAELHQIKQGKVVKCD